MNTHVFRLAMATALLAFIMGRTAEAGLTYDLRVSSDSSKSATLSMTPGSFVDLDLYALVTGTNSALEGFQYGYGSVTSTGANIKGSLASTVVDPFRSNGFQNGVQADLDGDFDLDVGSTLTSPNTSFIQPLSSGFATNPTGQFKLATIRFTLSSVVTPGGAPVLINFVPAAFSGNGMFEALWQEDGASVSSRSPGASLSTGTAVQVFVAVPEPASMALLGFGALACAMVRRRPS